MSHNVVATAKTKTVGTQKNRHFTYKTHQKLKKLRQNQPKNVCLHFPKNNNNNNDRLTAFDPGQPG